jgi:hypothetical protein
MYIYGGYDIREGPMSSMWSFDLSKVGNLDNMQGPPLHWNQLAVQGIKKPGALSNHSSVVYNKKMYLFGGSTGLNTNATLYGYEPGSNLWELTRVKAADNNQENLPQGSDEHTAVVHEDSMYVFGGFIDGDRVDFTYKFNFKSGEWHFISY